MTGLIGFILVWIFLPHKSEIDTVWQLITKLIVFMLIVSSIAFFPNNSKFGYLLLIIPFLFYAGYYIPRLGYYGYGYPGTLTEKTVGKFYTLLYLIGYPSLILFCCSSYRIGGGSPDKVIKIAIVAQLIIFSGFLDLFWGVANNVKTPEVFNNAHHVKIIIGHYPKLSEMIIFAILHIPLVIGVLILPLDKWIQKLSPEKSS